jgi:hypothetical protein
MDADSEGENLTSAEDEQRLVLIGIAIDRFFDRCEDTVLHTDHSLLCWLGSQHLGNLIKLLSSCLVEMQHASDTVRLGRR